MAPSPTVTPGSTTAPAPIHTSSQTRTGSALVMTFLRSSGGKS